MEESTPKSETTFPDTCVGYPLVDGILSTEFYSNDLVLDILLETNNLNEEELLDLNNPNYEDLIETSEPSEGDLSNLTMFPSNSYEEELFGASEPTEEDLSGLNDPNEEEVTETSEHMGEDLSVPSVSGQRMLNIEARLIASLDRNKHFVKEVAALTAFKNSCKCWNEQ